MMLLLGLAAAAGQPARSYDCAVLDAGYRQQSLTIVANEAGEPLALDGSFPLAGADTRLLERIGSYQGSRLRITKQGKDYFVTLRAAGPKTSAIMIEEVSGDVWPYQKARYSGICVASPQAVDPDATPLPQVSAEKFRWVFWFVRFVGPSKKVVATSWQSQCRVLNERGEQSRLGIDLRLSDKRPGFDATSPVELTVTDAAAASTAYKGSFSQSMAQEHGSKSPRVMTLAVRADAGSKPDKSYVTLFLRDMGGDLSQQIILEKSSGVVASGFCDPLDLKQLGGNIPPD